MGRWLPLFLITALATSCGASEAVTESVGWGRPRCSHQAVLCGIPELGPDERETDLSTALAIMNGHGCPPLPASGPASADQVTRAAKDREGQVVVEFEDELVIIYAPETRSPSEYLAQWRDSLASGGMGFKLVTLRGTSASAAEADLRGPATIAWVERSCGIDMYGDGGQSLADLISIAKSMPA